LKAERERSSRDDSSRENPANLDLLLVKPQELKDFNTKATKALATNDLKALKKILYFFGSKMVLSGCASL
jgi:hypothetical protein